MAKRRLDTIQHRLFRYAEPGLVVLGSIALYLSLAFFAPGGPFGTDVVEYINIGLNGLKTGGAFYERYFHILLQRIFLKAAPTPLQGTQFFWAFILASTCLLIYICARIFSPRSTPFHGLLAVALFLSIGVIADTVGIALIDLTAMFVVMLIVTVYLLSARVGHRSVGLVALLGFLFYLGFKTKETTLPAAILVLGLGFDGENKFDRSLFFKNILIFISGILASVVFFAIWTWIVVGDPLFGLRLSEYREYLSSYALGHTAAGQQQTSLDSWLTGFFFTTLLVPFFLYIVSGIKTPGLAMSRRLVWLVPWMIILFVSFSVGNWFEFQARFIFPSLPVICFLGPQFLSFDPVRLRKDRIAAVVLFCGGLALLAITRLLMRPLVPLIGWELIPFVYVVFYPLLLMCISAVIFLLERPGLKASILVSILIIALLTSPLARSFKVLFVDHTNQAAMDVVFYPFSAFSKEIVYSPGMHLFISRETWSVLGNPFYTKNLDEIKDTFNVYFNANSTRDNFTFADVDPTSLSVILTSGYTSILLSQTDWQVITDNPQLSALAKQKYQVFFEPKKLLVLLKAQ